MLAYLDRAVAVYSAARQAAPAVASAGAEGAADGDAAAAAAAVVNGLAPANGDGEAGGSADPEELARYGFRSVEDVRARVCLYKARHFLSTRNVKVRLPPPQPSSDPLPLPRPPLPPHPDTSPQQAQPHGEVVGWACRAKLGPARGRLARRVAGNGRR